ncbi:hypothetical protein [Paenibacillus thalictri]|uniref:Immunity protein 30 domain-containing protein n=1 Tax=Paenibacillus thalictri TaxID=2527873 RepID=A0A4Q9DJS0_9BACL|nr:hypothetical protein [Paenibacillus thalictri]TBL71231.1 hypothetical protein EYB31_31155 [Paenibacillus thalictri]
MADILQMYRDAINSDCPERKIDEIADILEYGKVNKEMVKVLIYEMMEHARREQDGAIKESLFNAMSLAAVHQNIGEDIEWDPLLNDLETVNVTYLEDIILCLGFSRKAKYLSVIKTYLSHPKQQIVQCAEEAIEEINYKMNKVNTQKGK